MRTHSGGNTSGFTRPPGVTKSTSLVYHLTLTRLDDAALGLYLLVLHQPSWCYEVELIGVPHPDSPLQRVLQLGQKIAPGDFHLVADPLHPGVRERVQGERVQPLQVAVS